MGLVFGPSDQDMEPRSGTNNYYYFADLPAGASAHVSINDAALISGSGWPDFDVFVVNADGPLTGADPAVFEDSPSFATVHSGGWVSTWTFTAAHRYAFGLNLGGGSAAPQFGRAYGVEVYIDAPTGGFCAYGTQPKPTVSKAVIITDTLITLLLAGTGFEWVAIVLDGLSGATLFTDVLCAGPPPQFPPLGPGDLITVGSVTVPNPLSANAWQAMQAVAWPYFCQCNPAVGGAPAPIPFPGPGVTTSSGDKPTTIAVPCDEGDVCSLIKSLSNQLAALNAQVLLVRQDVTLIQRQHVPFAYLHGGVHAGLTGHGSVDVADLIGVKVAFTTVPGYLGLEDGTPQANLWLGWLHLGTADGWLEGEHLVANPTLLLPIDGAVTKIGYSFEAGVVATITELVREP